MIYKFRSFFNRDNDYTIVSDEPLELYNDFSLSIKKIDNENKSYSYDNIDCVLKYGHRGTLGIKKYDLDKDNFTGFHKMVETFKRRNCLSMGEAIELIVEKKPYEYEGVKLDNADQELKIAFEKHLKDSGMLDNLFQCFLQGVSYGKNKTHL